MDIVIAVVVCLLARLILMRARIRMKAKKKREPKGAFLFGSWYYWYQVNRPAHNRQ